MLNLSLNKLKQITKMRCSKGYKNMSKEGLLCVISKSESAKSFDNIKIQKIRENLNKSRHKFSKSKTKEIKKILSALKKYYDDHDDAKYIFIRDVGNLFNQSTDKDYYKPIKTKSAFNGNYIENESSRDKNKILLAKKYLNMITPYLGNIINDYKAFKILKVHSGNEVSYYKSQFRG